MLKPSRKILRKEIKKDPLLDTFEKVERVFEDNRKTLMKSLSFISLLLIGGAIIFDNQNEIELESSSAFGAALVAYSNADYDNAKFQFESISSSYEGTESEILSKYYLGKIAFELSDFSEANRYLNDFLDKTKKPTLVCGAIKMLVDIAYLENDYIKSFDILAKAKKFDIHNVSMLELKLLEINTFIKINDLQSAKDEIGKILNDKKLPLYIEQKINEFEAQI